MVSASLESCFSERRNAKYSGNWQWGFRGYASLSDCGTILPALGVARVWTGEGAAGGLGRKELVGDPGLFMW